MTRGMKNLTLMRKLYTICFVIGYVLLARSSVSSGTDIQSIVLDDTIGARSDIGYGNEVVASAWAGDISNNNHGVYVATKNLSDPSFSSPVTIKSDPGLEFSPPKVEVYNGSPIVVWTERDTSTADTFRREIQEYENGTIRTIASICSHYALPDVAVGKLAVHVVYTDNTDCTQASASLTNLYYTKRLHGTNTWSTPVKIVDRHDANTVVGYSDQIHYPRVAVNADDSAVYVVWEQEINRIPSVWYTSGYSNTWGDVQRISLVDATSEQQAINPAITLDGSDDPHFTWTELVRDESGVLQYQNIYHRTFTRPTATQINFQRIYVTDNLPTYTISDVAAYGTYICAAWYSYDDSSPDNLEDVYVRCSSDAGQQSWSMTMDISQSEELLSPYPAIVIDNHYDMHIGWAEMDLIVNKYETIGLYYNKQTATYDEPLAVYFPISRHGSK